MKKYVIKSDIERDDGNNYLFDSSPAAIDWTSLYHAKKFESFLEAQLYAKQNFIHDIGIIQVTIRNQ